MTYRYTTAMKLHTFNDLLSCVVIGLGIYIVVLPFLPQIQFALRDTSPEASAPYSGSLAQDIGSDATAEAPKENRLVIPSIQLNEPILEGNSINTIHKGGTWRRPNSSTPSEGGNTVIVGHRYYGSNVSTFYHLDKVLVGQKLALYWDGREQLYEVVESKVVDPSEIEIEDPTDDKRLTIYTCTPIWTAKNRLVIIAKPIGEV